MNLDADPEKQTSSPGTSGFVLHTVMLYGLPPVSKLCMILYTNEFTTSLGLNDTIELILG